jgi:hypothetical protein
MHPRTAGTSDATFEYRDFPLSNRSSRTGVLCARSAAAGASSSWLGDLMGGFSIVVVLGLFDSGGNGRSCG